MRLRCQVASYSAPPETRRDAKKKTEEIDWNPCRRSVRHTTTVPPDISPPSYCVTHTDPRSVFVPRCVFYPMAVRGVTHLTVLGSAGLAISLGKASRETQAAGCPTGNMTGAATRRFSLGL